MIHEIESPKHVSTHTVEIKVKISSNILLVPFIENSLSSNTTDAQIIFQLSSIEMSIVCIHIHVYRCNMHVYV
jgi:hypothetical protein